MNNMKEIHIYILTLILMSCMTVSCKKMDSTFRQYVVTGGNVYPAKATSPLVYSGRNRIKIAWLRGADASVTKAKIYWNNKLDSVSVDIPATGDTISAIIGNLLEKQYNFTVITSDGKGHFSVPVDLLGESFSTRYESLLLTRPINSSEVDPSGNLTITWGLANASGGAYATDVQYTNTSNATTIRRFPVSQASSTINDYKAGTTFQYRTVYLPGIRSIDSFFTPYVTQYVSSKINKSTWLATADSYALTSQFPNGSPARAIDDNIATYWHTETTSSRVYPHWLSVDMKKPISITRVELTCRQDNFTTFTAFTVQGSTDGISWTDQDTFTLLGKNDTQSFQLSTVLNTRYIRIYASAGPNYYANLAEFSVYGYE